MGHQSYVLLCRKMTSFPPSEGVSKIMAPFVLDLYALTHLMYDEDGLKRHGYQADDKIRHGKRE